MSALGNLQPTTSPHPADDPVRTILDAARRAPSIHNTQPWTWRAHGHDLQLHADRSRQLTATDPEGRNLMLSCGAALHYAVTAAGALGWDAGCDLQPDGGDPDLVARLRLTRGRAPRDAESILRSLDQRRTDRRRFTNWPIPHRRLRRLAATSRVDGVEVVPLTDPLERWRAELQISVARRTQNRDRSVLAEEQRWVDRPRPDGMPAQVVYASHDFPTHLDRWPTRFDDDSAAEPAPSIEGADGLLVVGTRADDVGSWIRAGVSLTALWLRATTEGISLVPLSQVVEVPETRAALTHEVLGSRLHPQLLLRIGWQEIGRSDLPRTPRRALEERLQP